MPQNRPIGATALFFYIPTFQDVGAAVFKAGALNEGRDSEVVGKPSEYVWTLQGDAVIFQHRLWDVWGCSWRLSETLADVRGQRWRREIERSCCLQKRVGQLMEQEIH